MIERINVDVSNCSSNIFAILGLVNKKMRHHHLKVDKTYDYMKIFTQMDCEIKNSAKSYDEALMIINKYVELII